jgi:hypothetical protein
MAIRIAISHGELIDKITILEIKAQRIGDAAKRANVEKELALLRATWAAHVPSSPALDAQIDALRAVNAKLWDVEDALRDKERQRQFDAEFIELARSVYFTNDERARIKRAINQLLDSDLIEEKSYQAY